MTSPTPEQADATVDAASTPAESAKGEPFTPPAFAASTIGSAEWTPPTPLGPDAVTEDPWGGEPESMPAFGAEPEPELEAETVTELEADMELEADIELELELSTDAEAEADVEPDTLDTPRPGRPGR